MSLNSLGDRKAHRYYQRGNAYIEYLVVALAVLLATVAFYQSHLKDEGVGVRKSVEQAFDKMVDKVLKP